MTPSRKWSFVIFVVSMTRERCRFGGISVGWSACLFIHWLDSCVLTWHMATVSTLILILTKSKSDSYDLRDMLSWECSGGKLFLLFN